MNLSVSASPTAPSASTPGQLRANAIRADLMQFGAKSVDVQPSENGSEVIRVLFPTEDQAGVADSLLRRDQGDNVFLSAESPEGPYRAEIGQSRQQMGAMAALHDAVTGTEILPPKDLAVSGMDQLVVHAGTEDAANALRSLLTTEDVVVQVGS